MSHATVVAYLALFMAMSGTAVAATGGSFILGRSNEASSLSTLTSSAGPALSLRSPAGTPPMQVNRTVRVANLNADLLDGIDSTGFVARADFDALQADHAALAAQVVELQALLAGVSRVQVDGHDTMRFSNMNMQIVNGRGATDRQNGRGNLIIGYNGQRITPVSRTGSHYLVVGDKHQWTQWGGIVAGTNNTVSGPWASVTGGGDNTASGWSASVTGGGGNHARGFGSSVSGGRNNVAAEGADDCQAQYCFPSDADDYSSVAGGRDNIASGKSAFVAGGQGNHASGAASSILGGERKTAANRFSCHPSCP